MSLNFATTQGKLTATGKELEAAKGDLASTVGQLDTTNRNLSATKTALTATGKELETANRDLASTVGQLDTANRNLSATKTALATTEGQLTATGKELETAKRDLASTVGQLDATIRDLSATKIALGDANADRANIRVQLANTLSEKALLGTQLSQTQTQVQTLQTTNNSLRNRVQQLEAEQSKYYVSSFYCTGSMEPYITCADEAVWKLVFVSSDIRVGTVISFRNPPACASGRGGSTSHRVIDIKMEGGSWLYRTKGDGNRAADPCWIPTAYVNGVLALLRKGARPENVIDTTEYRIATQELYSIADQRDIVNRQYEAAWALYSSEYARLCGFSLGLNITCYVSSSNVLYLNSLYSYADTLWRRFNQLADAYSIKLIQLLEIECRIFKLCR
jgi:hypothetical protein